MISVKVLQEWHELDTLNGYYCLRDLFRAVGSPADKSPDDFVRLCAPHKPYTIRINKTVWASQIKVYEYAAFLDPHFDAVMKEYLVTKDVAIARTIATGVTHK